MARQKRKSDEVYNKRRKAQRFVNSLKKQQERSKSAIERRALGKYINNLEKQIKFTYRGSGKQPDKAFDVIEGAMSFAKGSNAKARSNKIFQQQIGLASSGAQSSLGKLGKEKSKIFYAATQRFWEGISPSKRNEAIIAGMGVSTLGEAYDKVMKKQGKAINAAKGLYEPIKMTSENADFYSDMSVSNDIETSPDYVSLVYHFG